MRIELRKKAVWAREGLWRSGSPWARSDRARVPLDRQRRLAFLPNATPIESLYALQPYSAIVHLWM